MPARKGCLLTAIEVQRLGPEAAECPSNLNRQQLISQRHGDSARPSLTSLNPVNEATAATEGEQFDFSTGAGVPPEAVNI
ncbi:hypothetical protein ACFWIB_38465 [Streptomyces sp. NPDC127051]|uniref:hypothetical protein n=1 Tax=Streptomyces sp. NPDC127051 TaxID=3347119 RepID=UPI00364B3C4A